MFRQLVDSDAYILRYDTIPLHVKDEIYFVIKQETTDYWGDKPEVKYHTELWIVSPALVDKSVVVEWSKDNGYGEDLWDMLPFEGRLEFLIQASLCAWLWQQGGNNRGKLYRDAVRAANSIRRQSQLSGTQSYLSHPQNAVGTLAIEWLRGRFP